MADHEQNGKDEPTMDVEAIPVSDVQARLSELVNRAGFANERIVLTRHGKQTAALIGLKDLERLRSMDTA
jgi:prevent-host-death family protein